MSHSNELTRRGFMQLGAGVVAAAGVGGWDRARVCCRGEETPDWSASLLGPG